MQISLEISATKHDVSGPKKVCGGVCWGGVGGGGGVLATHIGNNLMLFSGATPVF